MRRTAAALMLIFLPALAGAQTGPGITSYTFEITASPAPPMIFHECSKIGTQHDIVEQRVATKTGDAIVKLPGVLRVVNIECRRGLSTSKALDLWRQDVESGKGAKRNGSIRVLDYTGSEVAVWNFTGGWPSELFVEALEDGSGVLESFSLTLDTIVRQ
jgi:phage tail-like protein